MALRLSDLRREPRRPAWVRSHPGAWRLAVGTVCVGAFMGQLDASIVTVAIPTLQRSFHASVAATTWVGLAYLVVLVSLVAPAGRFADLHGRKLTYLYGFVAFSAASLCCALAPDLPVLVACRAVQGLGAAMLQANSVAIITAAAPRDRLRSALGVQSAAQALGLAAGPTVGGALLATFGWRALFLVNVPTGLLAVALGWVLIPRSAALEGRRRLDACGVALLAIGVGAGLCALSLGGGRDLGIGWALALLAGSAAALVGFQRHERRAASPLFRLELLSGGGTAPRLVAAALCFVALFGMLLAVPYLLEVHLHLGTTSTGAVLASLPFAVGVAGAIAGRSRHGTGLAVAGTTLCALSLAAFAVAHADVGVITVELLGAGAGIGMFLPTNTSAVMSQAPAAAAGELSGLVGLARGVGTGVGLGLAALVLGSVAGTGGVELLAALLGLAALAAAVTSLAAGVTSHHEERADTPG